MSATVELDYNQLKKKCDKRALGFDTIRDISEYSGAIGQEKASKALEFGLAMRDKSYNIYVSGSPGLGKMTFAKSYAQKYAIKRETPPDLCYIYNFKEPRRPKLLTISGGKGKQFREDMEELVFKLSNEIPQIFSSREYESQKHEIIRRYQGKRDMVIRDITEEAKQNDFGVKMTNTGIYFMPIIDGEMISEEQFEALEEGEKESINARSTIISDKAQEVMRVIKEYEKSTHKEVNELEYNLGLQGIGCHVAQLQEKYADIAEIIDYLTLVREDILENLTEFLEVESEEEEYIQTLMPWASKKDKSSAISKYKVNLLTDNSELNGAPVIVDFNPTYASLIGEVEYDSEFGNLTTDFMKIKPGLIHKANGGFLILQARDVLSNSFVWEALRKCLITRKASIEPVREYSTGIAVAGLKPETVDIDIKVLLIGSGYYYNILCEYDEEFKKLFKINAIFDNEMRYTVENINLIAGFVKRLNDSIYNMDFDNGAVAGLIEYSGRLAENQDKLSTHFGKLKDILTEACAYAQMDNKKLVTEKYIKKAIAEKETRSNIYEEKFSEIIERNIIKIETEGSKIGQVNGLAIMDAGDCVFAVPSRITATAYVGKAGVVNIEKEAEMSGNIHDKGVQVLIGYLGQTYAQDFPLSLSCRICFEQNYNGIDGDSASSTELYAILSTLAEVPIKQEIAVTGSISQRGEIQAIGGVTRKIEGFYDLCKKRGLNGKQGVIIPQSNVNDLFLNDDLINAVKKGMFHIYPITHISQGIEILTGIPAGEKTDGKYPTGSINHLVSKKLKKFYKKAYGV